MRLIIDIDAGFRTEKAQDVRGKIVDLIQEMDDVYDVLNSDADEAGVFSTVDQTHRDKPVIPVLEINEGDAFIVVAVNP